MKTSAQEIRPSLRASWRANPPSRPPGSRNNKIKTNVLLWEIEFIYLHLPLWWRFHPRKGTCLHCSWEENELTKIYQATNNLEDLYVLIFIPYSHIHSYLQYSSPRYESPTETIAMPIPTFTHIIVSTKNLPKLELLPKHQKMVIHIWSNPCFKA